MNHLFLMQVHTEHAVLDAILSRLEAENHYFAINIDAKSNIGLFKEILERHSNILYITYDNINHGAFTMIQCTLEQLAYSFECGIHFDYYHTLSGQDYPCVSNQIFDMFFAANKGRSYMMVDPPLLAEEGRKGKYVRRLECWNFADTFNSGFARRIKLSSIVKKLLSPIKHNYKHIELKIWGGWNWFSLHKNAIDYLMDYVKKNPAYVKSFRYSYCGDELFYPTILYPERERLNIEVDNSLRYVEWHAKRYCATRPLVLDEREYEDIVYSGSFFCRKVTTGESKKLMELLDARIQNMGLEIPTMNPKRP